MKLRCSPNYRHGFCETFATRSKCSPKQLTATWPCKACQTCRLFMSSLAIQANVSPACRHKLTTRNLGLGLEGLVWLTVGLRVSVQGI